MAINSEFRPPLANIYSREFLLPYIGALTSLPCHFLSWRKQHKGLCYIAVTEMVVCLIDGIPDVWGVSLSCWGVYICFACVSFLHGWLSIKSCSNIDYGWVTRDNGVLATVDPWIFVPAPPFVVLNNKLNIHPALHFLNAAKPRRLPYLSRLIMVWLATVKPCSAQFDSLHTLPHAMPLCHPSLQLLSPFPPIVAFGTEDS